MEDAATFIGSLGVTLLLLAFLLNIAGRLRMDSAAYLSLNFLGAGLAGLSAWLIDFLPFVILEGTWALVAALMLLRRVLAHRP